VKGKSKRSVRRAESKVEVMNWKLAPRNWKRQVRDRIHCLFLTPCIFLVIGINTSFSQTNDSTSISTRLDLRTMLIRSSSEIVSDGQSAGKRKSPGLAAFASLAIPGLGELYAGRYDAGKFSTIAEVSLWVFYTVLEIHSNQVRSDAINYARMYAGAQIGGKPEQFFVDMGNFINTNDYNSAKVNDGDYALIYNPLTMPSYQWQWQSDADRARFKDMRIEADQFLNYGRYTAAVIVLNHLISAINAARLAAGVNASAASSLDNSSQTTGIYLRLAASF